MPGGAGNLANLVKAFAAAGIVNRVVAVFDNDTAAESSLASLRTVALPTNIQTRQLPSLPALSTYPTLGPTGMSLTNVNGLAASLELYLGTAQLLDEGALSPVQWTGYDSKLRKYQGEVLGKEQIHRRFEKKLLAASQDPGTIAAADWTGLKAVLGMIFRAFNEVDGLLICRSAQLPASD